ncbi:MAG: DMT family transporter [Melioribacteraceae bacterium]|nr:DMT family transporter [Melioribacteraceae bacterium]
MDILIGMKNNSSSVSTKKWLAESVLIIITLLWGATFVIIKESIESVSTLLFVAFRFLLAVLLLSPLVFLNRKYISRKIIKAGFLLGILLFLGFAFQTVGLKYTSATKSAFITGTFVVLVPIFQTVIEKRIPSKGAMLGTFLVFIGLIFLSTGGESILGFLEMLGSEFNLGDFLTLLCAVVFALQIVYLDVHSPHHNFWVLTYFQILTTSVLGFIGALLFDAFSIENLKFTVNEDVLFGIFYTGVFATFIALSLQTRFQRLVSPTKAGIIYAFEPIFAAVFAFFLLHEKISNFGFIGSVLIFLGLITSEVYDRFVIKNGR